MPFSNSLSLPLVGLRAAPPHPSLARHPPHQGEGKKEIALNRPHFLNFRDVMFQHVFDARAEGRGRAGAAGA